jgi:hypothetical protein
MYQQFSQIKCSGKVMLGSHLQDTVVILDMVEALVKVEAEAHVMVVPIEESLIMAEIVMVEIVMV